MPPSGQQTALAFDSRTTPPFSRGETPDAIARIARELAGALGLPAEVRIVEGNGVAGLDLERGLRLRWWTSGDEPLRATLHRAKTRVYREARETGRWERLTRAWREAERVVQGDAWRAPLRRLVQDLGPEDAAFVRLAFRAAQQAASRAARWQAVLDGANPFIPLAELFAHGAWPLGVVDGALQVFVWNPEATPRYESVPTAEVPVSEKAGGVLFLSAQFRDAGRTSRWEEVLRSRGWKVVHGPVDEETSSPEVQLGERIRGASAVLGLLGESDPDFGLPWWMFQELDYARACGRPIALIPGLPDDPSASSNDHEIWRWLDANARQGET
ncbi:MAG TPA: hypothetical protein VLT87_28900 [Thermoanaerobaculia bacterium]|nr:hypothetical protein [Thermoanaerobaculia bacterium]